MVRRKLLFTVIGILALAYGGVLVTLAADRQPNLGIDLRGGLSVTFVIDGDYPRSAIERARDQMEANASGVGVAEPEVLIQGDTIVANLPQVEDTQTAIDQLQVTGELSIRPALQQCVTGPEADDTTTTSTSTSTTTTVAGGSTTTAGTTTTSTTTTVLVIPPDLISANPTTTTTIDPDAPVTLPPVGPFESGSFLARGGLFPCQLGPEAATGEIFDGDNVSVNVRGASWAVTVDFADNAGEDLWNALAVQCFNGTSSCPTRQIAIVLDGKVISAPDTNADNFNNQVTITLGDSSETEARNLASVLERGALPVRFEGEPNIEQISATLGEDSLRAAWISGLVGIGLVLLFVLLYYGRLGVLAIAGLSVSAGLLWTVITLMSATSGLALTLPGIAGIIVSVGVTIDSYVVFFERLKDEVRAGRTVKNSTPRAFTGAWRTIVVADLVSFIGALTLWWLSAGNVRGFAFFLGLSTLTDMVVAYFFTRPAALLLSRTPWMAKQKIMGLHANVDGGRA